MEMSKEEQIIGTIPELLNFRDIIWDPWTSQKEIDIMNNFLRACSFNLDYRITSSATIVKGACYF